jgi:tetrahydromethanopterin S-methyltransferase subunit E
MAHFAKINSDNIIEQVTGISNCAIGSCIGESHWDYQEEYHKDHDKGIDFPESEELGQAVLAESGFDGKWLQTSYNGKFRGRFAGAGMIYDPIKDEFVIPEAPEATPAS